MIFTTPNLSSYMYIRSRIVDMWWKSLKEYVQYYDLFNFKQPTINSTKWNKLMINKHFFNNSIWFVEIFFSRDDNYFLLSSFSILSGSLYSGPKQWSNLMVSHAAWIYNWYEPPKMEFEEEEVMFVVPIMWTQ